MGDDYYLDLRSKLIYLYLRITVVRKVETDIIASIAASLIVPTMIMNVKALKTDLFVFISDVIMFLVSHWPISF